MEEGLFGLILSLVSTLMHAYVSWRIATLPWFDVVGRRKVLLLCSLAIWLIYLAGVQLGHGISSGMTQWLHRLALDWLGILFITTTVMLLSDLVTGFGRWSKVWAHKIKAGGLALALMLVVVAFVQGNRAPVVTPYEVKLAGLPASLDGTRIAVLSDLHLDSRERIGWLSERVEQVRELKPDLILLLGDIFEGHGELNGSLQPVFSRLKAPLGVYAVTGNHEFHSDNGEAIAVTEKSGVVWLRNAQRQLAPGLILAGVDNISGSNSDGAARIASLLKSRRDGVTILLSHSPRQVEAAAELGTELMLSGHTHGGQIWPFSYLVANEFGYLAGRYEVGGMTLLIGRGTGLWGPRMRLWRPSEILQITLTGSDYSRHP